MGPWDVPTVPRTWGIICLIHNILIPGTGTLMAAGKDSDLKQYAFGLIQMLLFWTFIPWAWSIAWGVLIFMRSEA